MRGSRSCHQRRATPGSISARLPAACFGFGRGTPVAKRTRGREAGLRASFFSRTNLITGGGPATSNIGAGRNPALECMRRGSRSREVAFNPGHPNRNEQLGSSHRMQERLFLARRKDESLRMNKTCSLSWWTAPTIAASGRQSPRCPYCWQRTQRQSR